MLAVSALTGTAAGVASAASTSDDAVSTSVAPVGDDAVGKSGKQDDFVPQYPNEGPKHEVSPT